MRLFCLLLGCYASGGVCGGAQVGAPWPGAGGCPDQAHHSSASGPRSGQPLWSRHGLTSPSVAADGTLYSAYDQLHAIAPDGTPRWISADLADTVPAIGFGGRLFYAGGSLVARDPDGSTVWSRPLTTYARMVLLAGDGSLRLAGDSGLQAFDAGGTPRWTYPLSGDFIQAMALGSDGTSYLALSSSISAVDSDGRLRWSLPGTSGSITAAADGTVWVNGGVHVLGAGTVDTRLPIGRGPAIAADGTLYLGVNGALHAYAADGRELWSDALSGAPDTGEPVVDAGGNVYIAAIPWPVIDSPYTDDNRSTVYAFAAGGARLWSLDAGVGRAFWLALGDHRLYVSLFGNSGNELIAVGN